MRIIFIAFTFFICLLALTLSAFGQTVADGKPDIIPSNSSGEYHSALTDSLAVELQHSNERLFVIVIPGTGETSSLNLARLMSVKSYLSAKRYGSQQPVFAEGERAKGEGRIEYYVGSQLRLVMFAPQNKIPNFTCCNDYIPPKRKPRRKKGNR